MDYPSSQEPCEYGDLRWTEKKVVHINRLRHRVLPQQLDSNMSGNNSVTWHPPQIDHVILPPMSSPTPQRRYVYPQRDRHTPDRYTA